MQFKLKYTITAESQYKALKNNSSDAKRFKAVRKTLGLLTNNPRHPSLNSHKYDLFQGTNGEEVFEVYAENKTPAAFRVFWHYGPGSRVITVIAITPHP